MRISIGCCICETLNLLNLQDFDTRLNCFPRSHCRRVRESKVEVNVFCHMKSSVAISGIHVQCESHRRSESSERENRYGYGGVASRLTSGMLPSPWIQERVRPMVNVRTPTPAVLKRKSSNNCSHTADMAGFSWCFTVWMILIDFDTERGRRSVTVAQFHPTMLGKPASGETDRRYPVIEIFESPDRAKALHDANSKAEQLLQDIVKSYEADFPHFSESTEGVKEDGMIWRVAMSIFGRQRCEIQINEQPAQEIPSSPTCPAIGMSAESFNQMKARTDALLAAFDPWLNLEHHEWPPLPESSKNEEP